MNYRERLEATLHGGKPDQVPFAPYDNLVPRGAFERELGAKGMGLLDRLSGRIWSEMPNVEIEHRTEGTLVTTTYHTPEGDVSTESRTHLGRVSDSASVQTAGLIKDVKDFDAVIFMIEDTVFHVNNGVYHDTKRTWGSHGYLSDGGPRVPYEASRGYFGEYAGIPAWVYAQHDHPDHFAALLDALTRREERKFPLILASPADLISFGSVDGNYGPRRWRERILPVYKKYVPRLQEAGKKVSIHAHASTNKAYVDVIGETGVDIVEAFTPPPVGDLSIADARKAWGPEKVIWVNFPETIFYFGFEETKQYTINLLKSDAPGHRLVIGFTEMGTFGITDAESERVFKNGFRAVAEAIDEHGHCPIA